MVQYIVGQTIATTLVEPVFQHLKEVILGCSRPFQSSILQTSDSVVLLQTKHSSLSSIAYLKHMLRQLSTKIW